MTALFSELPRTRAEAKAVGSKYYFTGKPCKRGHISKRKVCDKSCCVCKVELTKNYNEVNRESIREQKKARYAANKESSSEQSKAYYAANKDRRKAYIDANKESIRERMKAYKKSYRESNRDAIREQQKAWYAEKVGKSPEEIGTRRTPDPARHIYFLVVKDVDTNEKLFLKVGVTNNPTGRLKQHKHQLAKHGLMFDMILIKDFETGEAARAIELKIKNNFIVYESDITGFKSECFMYLPQFEASMLALIDSPQKI